MNIPRHTDSIADFFDSPEAKKIWRQEVIMRTCNRIFAITFLLSAGFFAGYFYGFDAGRAAQKLEKEMQSFYKLDADRQLREFQIIKNQLNERSAK